MATGAYMLLAGLVLVVIGTSGVEGQQSWCVAKDGLSDQQLQAALEYACGPLPGAGADCGPIQQGGPCYEPNTPKSHASYAFNSYYQQEERQPGTCEFNGCATITTTNPSYGSCIYPTG